MNKRVHAFSKSITSKVNVVVWLEFELAYIKVGVKHFSLCAIFHNRNKFLVTPNK